MPVTVDIHLENLSEFRKSDRYPEKLVKLAEDKDKKLTLEDIYRFYKEFKDTPDKPRLTIEIFISGHNGMDGRQQFSRLYNLSDIVDGDFDTVRPFFDKCNKYKKNDSIKKNLIEEISKLKQ